ncbi:hypothetical protein L7F22_037231 [Adiantum nelumboides]|nr:hypothetical protein [Adiantum nelumboides]
MTSQAPNNNANGSGVLSKLKKRFSSLGAPTPTKSSSTTSGAAAGSEATPVNDANAAPTTATTAPVSSKENKPSAKQDQAPPPPPDKDDKPAPSEAALTSTPDNATYTPKSGLRTPYPAVEPFKTGTLKVDDLHEIYWEASGNPEGVPAVFLHGGPGGATSVSDRQWFDPKHYAIYLFDQRGCGKSLPHADLTNNTTWDIVKDIEKLRQHFGHEKWHVFGGSWGSCLSLAYAQTHPDRVLSLTLRGIFTLRRSELEFFYQHGSSFIFPEQFESYYEHIPEEENSDLIAAYYKRLTSDDKDVRLQAAKRWTRWEMSTLRLYTNEEVIKRADVDDYAVAFARIESHYFVNAGWMEDGQLLKKENIDKIRHIPATIIQGRYDVVCPAKTAYDLHKVWPQADYYLIPDAAHASGELGIAHQLISATDKYRSIKA